LDIFIYLYLPTMKKFLIPAVLVMLTINSFAQEWTKYKFDENLTVSVPEDYSAIDTLGQHIVSAKVDNGIILVQRLPNTGLLALDIRDKDELIKRYEEFQKGVVLTSQGVLIKQENEEMNGILVTRFSCTATMGEEKQLRHFFVFFLNENWYTINFWEVESMTDEVKADREALFSSIEIPDGLSIKNQMTTKGSPSYKMGYMVGKALGFILIPGAIVAIIVVVIRAQRIRKKKNEMTPLQ
jgi:hypothetical protein